MVIKVHLSGWSELPLFRSGAHKKMNLYFALVSDIRFFVNPECILLSNGKFQCATTDQTTAQLWVN
jgi:hypothetical protein